MIRYYCMGSVRRCAQGPTTRTGDKEAGRCGMKQERKGGDVTGAEQGIPGAYPAASRDGLGLEMGYFAFGIRSDLNVHSCLHERAACRWSKNRCHRKGRCLQADVCRSRSLRTTPGERAQSGTAARGVNMECESGKVRPGAQHEMVEDRARWRGAMWEGDVDFSGNGFGLAGISFATGHLSRAGRIALT